ncbi:MAG: hypothetical protein ABJA67_05855 [Chthonomonadales bacterium]
MRFEDYQKYIDSQFLDVKAEVASLPEQVTIAPVLAEQYSAPAVQEVEYSAPVAEHVSTPVAVTQQEPVVSVKPKANPVAQKDSRTTEVHVPDIATFLPFLKSTEPSNPDAAGVVQEWREQIEVVEVSTFEHVRDESAEEQIEAIELESGQMELPLVAEPVKSSAGVVVTQKRRRAARHISRSPDAKVGSTEFWRLSPRHLQALFIVHNGDEQAKIMSRTFKENRIEVIQRLLDPNLSLGQTARVLKITPCKVRELRSTGNVILSRLPAKNHLSQIADALKFVEQHSHPQAG